MSGSPYVRPSRRTNYSLTSYLNGISAIFDELRFTGKLPTGKKQQISSTSKIPLGTLKKWRHRLLRDPSIQILHHGHTGRSSVLHVDIENEIYDRIMADYMSPSRYCPRNVLQAIARDVATRHGIVDFKGRRTWCRGFLKRYGLSMRVPHLRRRTKQNDEIVAKFLDEFDVALTQLPLELILNMDETCWRVINGTIRTVARRGSDEVSVNVGKSDKEAITVIACITAAGDRLPLWVLASGKTGRCERQYRDSPKLRGYIASGSLHISHSENGWATHRVMKEYLEWLSDRQKGRYQYLLWDLHTSHREESVKICASERQISLSYIPAGHTGEWQPLDKAIFGIMKASAQERLNRLMCRMDLSDITIVDALEIMLEIWGGISATTVKDAWKNLISIQDQEEQLEEEDQESSSSDSDSATPTLSSDLHRTKQRSPMISIDEKSLI